MRTGRTLPTALILCLSFAGPTAVAAAQVEYALAFDPGELARLLYDPS